MIAPNFVPSITFNPNEADFYLYGRQSDVKSFGNTSTTLQTDDLLADVVKAFGLDLEVAWIRQYHEIESGVDGKVRYQYGKDGTATVTGLRPELVEILRDVRERVAGLDTPRVQVVCASKMNRLGRSEHTVAQLQEAAIACGGRFFIWSRDSGRLLNPLDPMDRMHLHFLIVMAGKGESETKSGFVRDAQRIIASNNGRRSLGQRILGYETYRAINEHTGEPAPPGWAGKTVPLLRVREDHAELVREVFRLALQGLRPPQIAAEMTRRYGNYPFIFRKTIRRGGKKVKIERERPWSDRIVRRILRSSIYIGRRVFNTSVQVGIASGKYERVPEEYWIRSPYDATLRIIDDETWLAVQAIMDSLSKPKKTGGRPLKEKILFYRTGLLRCGICGHTVTVMRDKKGSSYRYLCCGRMRVHGQTICQSIDTKVVDEHVLSELRGMFVALREYAMKLEDEIRQDTATEKRKLLEAEVERLEAELRQKEEQFWRPDFRMGLSETMLSRFQDQLNMLAVKLEEAKTKLARWGDTEDIRLRKKQIERIHGILAFDESSFEAKQAAITDLMEAVWLWPRTPENKEQVRIWFQWKGMKETEAPQPLRIADSWELIDFDRMKQTIAWLIQHGELTVRDLTTPYFPAPIEMPWWQVNPFFEPGRLEGARQLTVLKLYVAAIAQYVDIARLRADFLPRLQELCEKHTLAELRRMFGMNNDTISKMLGKKPGNVERYTWLRYAERVGFALTEYRALPVGGNFYYPNGLDEMAYWLLGAEIRIERFEPEAGGEQPVKDGDETSRTGSRPPYFENILNALFEGLRRAA